MAFDEQFFKDFGAMQESIRSIKQDTEKIDAIGNRMTAAETTLKDIKPKVDAHEKTHQRAIGVAALASIVLAAIKEAFMAYISGGGMNGGGTPHT